MRIRRVKVGDELRVKTVKDRGDGRAQTIVQTWTVTEVYRHHVLTERNGIRQSFSFGELVVMGYEKTPRQMMEEDS